MGDLQYVEPRQLEHHCPPTRSLKKEGTSASILLFPSSFSEPTVGKEDPEERSNVVAKLFPSGAKASKSRKFEPESKVDPMVP